MPPSIRLTYAGGTEPRIRVVLSSSRETFLLSRGESCTCDASAANGGGCRVESAGGQVAPHEVYLLPSAETDEHGAERRQYVLLVPPPSALPAAAGAALQRGRVAVLRGLTTRPELNGLEAVLLWRLAAEADGEERWAVQPLPPPRRAPLAVRASRLTPLRAHLASREAALRDEARELVGAAEAGAAAGAMGFGPHELPAEVGVLHVLSHLSCAAEAPRFLSQPSGAAEEEAAAAGGASARTAVLLAGGELEAAGRVCRQWRGVCLARRALFPSCARDVAVRLRLAAAAAGAASGGAADGEYTLYHLGRAERPMRVYCHNVLSARPTEFLSLPAGGAANFSFVPCGGTIRPLEQSQSPPPTHLATRFTKLRLCPWLLRVKTDDYTFASSASRQGGALHQTYWNGQRSIALHDVPYATARASHPTLAGYAAINLHGTQFQVRLDAFAPRGCSAWGAVVCPDEPNQPRSACARHVALHGGGFAGRLTPHLDVTLDELAAPGDFDDEGRNGGWTLPLVPDWEASGQPADLAWECLAEGREVPADSREFLLLVPLDQAGERVCGLEPPTWWTTKAPQVATRVFHLRPREE